MNKQNGFAWLALLIIIATLAVAGSVGYVVLTERADSSTNTTTSDQTNKNTNAAPFKVPFAVSVPTGWMVIYNSEEINTVQGGGPVNSMTLEPVDLTFNEFNFTNVSFDWYSFNPSASLEDIAPLLYLYENVVPTPADTTIAGQPALTMQRRYDIAVDVGEPWYLSEKSILRLPSGQLLVIRAFYSTENQYQEYHGSIQAAVNSLILASVQNNNVNAGTDINANLNSNLNVNSNANGNTNNIFSFDNAQVGDQVAGMEIVSIGPYMSDIDFPVVNRKIEFSGQTTVTGTLTNLYSEFFGGQRICMGDFTDDTLMNLPIMDDEDRSQGFCFPDTEAVSAEYPPDFNGTATVTIDSFTIISYPSEVNNTAVFIDVN